MQYSENKACSDEINVATHGSGFAGTGFGKKMVVTQYNATTGAPNLSFGSGGAVVHSFGAFGSSLSAVAVDSRANKTYVVNEDSANVSILDGATGATSGLYRRGGAAARARCATV